MVERLLTAEQVADVLGCHSRTVYRLAETRRLPFYRIGGLLRVSEADLEDYLERVKVDAVA